MSAFCSKIGTIGEKLSPEISTPKTENFSLGSCPKHLIFCFPSKFYLQTEIFNWVMQLFCTFQNLPMAHRAQRRSLSNLYNTKKTPTQLGTQQIAGSNPSTSHCLNMFLDTYMQFGNFFCQKTGFLRYYSGFFYNCFFFTQILSFATCLKQFFFWWKTLNKSWKKFWLQKVIKIWFFFLKLLWTYAS